MDLASMKICKNGPGLPLYPDKHNLANDPDSVRLEDRARPNSLAPLSGYENGYLGSPRKQLPRQQGEVIWESSRRQAVTGGGSSSPGRGLHEPSWKRRPLDPVLRMGAHLSTMGKSKSMHAAPLSSLQNQDAPLLASSARRTATSHAGHAGHPTGRMAVDAAGRIARTAHQQVGICASSILYLHFPMPSFSNDFIFR